MSNSVVGSVYEQIIEDVLSTSRVDFEENGVDEGVLDELRRVSCPLEMLLTLLSTPRFCIVVSRSSSGRFSSLAFF
jgi:hypothetical protein